jgi:hypothetical protein
MVLVGAVLLGARCGWLGVFLAGSRAAHGPSTRVSGGLNHGLTTVLAKCTSSGTMVVVNTLALPNQSAGVNALFVRVYVLRYTGRTVSLATGHEE